jgi:iron complex outermembrane recepter protein
VASAVAQESVPAPPVAPVPAAPAAETTPLPPVVVETQQDAPKAKKAKAKKKGSSTGPVVATKQAAPPAPQQPTGPGNANASDKTAYGPVKDYVAKNTATGMKTDTPLKEIPQSVSVVGAEQIRDQGAHNIQEALRYVPGVVADAYGVDGRADGHFIRGTEATEYLDGMKRTFSYYTYNYRMDPYFLERIEVLRGPASVLYGQAPVGGIINAVSKRPQTEQGGEIGIEYGTFDFKQVKFDMTGPVTSDGKWSYRLTGTARDAGTQVDNVDDDRMAIQPAITFRPDGDTAITVIGHFQRDRTGQVSQFFPYVGTLYPNINGRKIPRDTFIGEPDEHYDTDVNSGTLLVEHKFAPWLKMQHSSRYADLHNEYLSTYVYPWSYSDPNEQYVGRERGLSITNTQMFNQDTNLEAKFGTGLLQHRVLGGIDYSHFTAQTGSNSATDQNPSYSVYDPKYGQGQWKGTGCDGTAYGGTNNTSDSYINLQVCSMSNQAVAQTGAYIQDQMRLGNWIGVVGARKDWIENSVDGANTQRDDAISYRAGLMYEFASGLTPYLSYGESFVPVVGITSPANGSKPFDPKQGRMYEAGFKYAPDVANFAINGAVYDMTESNYLASDPGNPMYSVQTGAIAVKGVEIEVTGKLTENLKVVGGYSYTQAQYDDDTAVDGNQLESIPKHLASLWGVWEFDQPQLKGWSVGAGARYVGTSWDATNTVEVPSVTLFDAMVAYEEEHWRWQVTANNLEDKYYISTCLSRGDCWIGSARTITTGLTYKY